MSQPSIGAVESENPLAVAVAPKEQQTKPKHTVVHFPKKELIVHAGTSAMLGLALIMLLSKGEEGYRFIFRTWSSQFCLNDI